jgi:DNA modification methylase
VIDLKAIDVAKWPHWRSPGGEVLLVNAPCEDVLPVLPKVDCVITDPPYEGMKGGTVIDHAGVTERVEVTRTVGDELGNWQALAWCSRLAKRGAIVFCSYHKIDECAFLIGGDRRALLTWFKRNSPYSVNNAPWFQTEYAWAVQYAPGINWRDLKTLIDVPMLQAGCMASERIVNGGKSVHPAQKPLAVIAAVLQPGMDSVLDMYAGTATVNVACIKTGRQSIGIERDPAYFAIGKRRCEEALAIGPNSLFKDLAPTLFAEAT